MLLVIRSIIHHKSQTRKAQCIKDTPCYVKKDSDHQLLLTQFLPILVVTGIPFQLLPLLILFYDIDNENTRVNILSTHGLFINTPSNSRFHLHISPTSHFTTNKYTIRNEDTNAKRLLVGGNTTTIPSSIPSAFHCIVSVTRVILTSVHAIHHPIHSTFCDKVNGCYSILNNTLHILFLLSCLIDKA